MMELKLYRKKKAAIYRITLTWIAFNSSLPLKHNKDEGDACVQVALTKLEDSLQLLKVWWSSLLRVYCCRWWSLCNVWW